MLSTYFSTNCAFNFIQNTDYLIIATLGNTRAENKGLECTIPYDNIKSIFLNHVFYINFGPKPFTFTKTNQNFSA